MIINLEQKDIEAPSFRCPKKSMPHAFMVLSASVISYGVWDLSLECVDCGVRYHEILSEIYMQSKGMDFKEIRKIADGVK